MEFLIRDLGWALVRIRRFPILSFVVIASLALAIGAVTASFSVVNSFLLRPLPIDDIERLVRLRENDAPPGEPAVTRGLAVGNLVLWQDHNEVFEGIGAATGAELTLTGDGVGERFQGAAVTWNFFPLLGVKPWMGRGFSEQEDQPGNQRVVLLSHDLWRHRFNADPDILRQTLILNGEPHAVVGVMAQRFGFPYGADLWVPLGLTRDPSLNDEWFLYTIARLKPGVTAEQATAEMGNLVGRLGQEYPDPNAPTAADITPLREDLIRDLDRLLLLLFAAASFVLLIAGVNTSNLLIGQSLSRHTETAVQLALGANRRQILRQSISYTLLLSLMGGALGVLLSVFTVERLVALCPIDRSISHFDVQPRLDLPTLGFTLLACVLMGIALGLIPVLRSAKTDLSGALREGGRAASLGLWGRRVLSGFIVIEVAFALILLCSAGLMVQSFYNLLHKDRGFDPRGVLTFKVAFPEARYPDLQRKALFLYQARERLAALPGVTEVGATNVQPLFPGTMSTGFNIEGRPATNDGGYHLVHHRTTTPGYLEALGIRVVQGRGFTEADNEDAREVVLISESIAERYFPGENPVGQRLRRGLYDWDDRPWMTIVGVVATLDETQDEDLQTADAWYLPYRQTTSPDFTTMTFTLKTSSAPNSLVASARRAVADIDPEQVIFDIATLEELLQQRTARERSSALLFGVFGFLGLVLATLGVYGVLSFSVQQRHRELAVRKALGARSGELRSLVLKRTLGLTFLGLVVGLLGAVAMGRFLASMLHGVATWDPVTLLAAFGVLLVVNLACGFLPAQRASKIDPLQALRYE
jgi:putative ABC transport system permease protein